ncbi:hypothetical protein [Thermaerobacillus caldiproteolyticus]|uniref:Uncharacterized protein n=1 Tax=Thermaerobacillus caldiproteolyticus TaxID=247480 RepID=A0A7V9Z8E9_9BACL|nr:hypothetical protein [Anoxybacillus caldiproteolyticus]
MFPSNKLLLHPTVKQVCRALTNEENSLDYKVGRVSFLYEEVCAAILEEQIPIEIAIRVITSNPADLLKLTQKVSIYRTRLHR